jgi:polyisoprenoid-binding protein YceI
VSGTQLGRRWLSGCEGVGGRGAALGHANDGLAHFAIDMKDSLFTVQAFASRIIPFMAHSPKFAMRDVVGDISFVPEGIQNASVHVRVKVNSLEIMDEVTKSDRREIERVMFEEVLQAFTYPHAEYTSSQVTAAKTGQSTYRVTAMGDLTLHGITRGLKFESQVVTGEDTLRAQGSFSLLQSDFGLKIASVAEGTLKLKDELQFGYFVIARRRD